MPYSLFIRLLKDILVAYNCEQMGNKHQCAGFRVDMEFAALWDKYQEHGDCVTW